MCQDERHFMGNCIQPSVFYWKFKPWLNPIRALNSSWRQRNYSNIPHQLMGWQKVSYPGINHLHIAKGLPLTLLLLILSRLLLLSVDLRSFTERFIKSLNHFLVFRSFLSAPLFFGPSSYRELTYFPSVRVSRVSSFWCVGMILQKYGSTGGWQSGQLLLPFLSVLGALFKR